MSRIFDDKMKYMHLENLCDKWNGKKYLHMGMNENGVDCTKLIALIFVELGMITHVDNIRFSRDWFQHTNEEKAINEFTRHINEYSVNPYISGNLHENEPRPGDILFFRIRPEYVANHTAIYLKNDRIFHCIDGIGCHFTTYGFYWKQKFARALTIEGIDNWAWD